VAAPLSDIVRVQFKSLVSPISQTCLNTFHIGKAGSGIPSLATMTALATELQTAFTSTYRGMLRTADSWQSIIVSQIADPLDPDPEVRFEKTVNLAGTRTNPATTVPDAICAVASLRSPLASRRYRGHLFLPPSLDQASIAGQAFLTSNAYFLAAQALVATFATGVGPSQTWAGTNLSTWQLVLYSKRDRLDTGTYQTAVSAVTLSSTIHWLRSRQRGTT